ncbi:DgyrCDS3473 [Dimorphilus gyrociliatus]|uniref:Bystin n=1 Tax=Dimorphilus gyrociliatus TaxID=2664684 RepID=A0A7I8VDT8_9ANNE|nr:DgyrCDS3473 [Dimorphilus gyrociliatus]
MGKIKKSKALTSNAASAGSLAEQILLDKTVRPPGRVKDRKKKEETIEFVDDKLSLKILDQARNQQAELEEEYGVSEQSKKLPKTVKFPKSSNNDSDESDDDIGEFAYDQDEEIEIDEDEEKAMEKFMSTTGPVRRTLADIIQEKLTEKKTEIETELSDKNTLRIEDMDERVVKMYRSIRDILRCYRSGKLPKAFKIIPSLRNWEQVLYLTEPDSWTAAAVYQATRIFASNLNAKMAQRFFNLVLLPRIRDDISEYKRLNFHLYMALKKSLFKPAAFFKGVLLPLAECGNCTLREAIIVSSILAKNSIPMLHSAAALLKLAEMDYNGATSIFLRTLLDKKYALPYRVLDAVIFHFVRFEKDKRQLPVLWHQSLLTFVQRYKADISSEQKELLIALLRVHNHPTITEEVRKEIIHSDPRDVEMAICN